MKRKHISWKTKCAAALLHAMRDIAYDDAKKMTEDQFLSLWQFDHNMLHAFEDENRDNTGTYPHADHGASPEDQGRRQGHRQGSASVRSSEARSRQRPCWYGR